MQFDTKCIVCGTEQELDTILTVSIDGVKYGVSICNEHSEDITPKQVKLMVSKKLDELAELMNKLKEYGMEVKDVSGIAVVEKPVQRPQPVQKPEQEIEEGQERPAKQQKKVIKVVEEVSDTTIIKRGSMPRVSKISGKIDNQNIEGLDSINTSAMATTAIKEEDRKTTKIPVTESVEYQVVPGRNGIPMRVPSKIKHNDGSTSIAIINTGGDATLQNRFKELAAVSKDDRSNCHIYGRDGYDTDNCTMCRGSGINRVNGGVCPKCKGTGLLNRGLNRI